MHQHALELSIGLSFLLGMLHAMEPGHGKTAMFVYMLEGRKSFWHPIVMALTTALSHAGSLILIAFAVHLGVHAFAADEHAGHAHAGEALQWISSLLLIAVGLRLCFKARQNPAHAKQCRCCGGAGHAPSELPSASAATTSPTTLPTVHSIRIGSNLCEEGGLAETLASSPPEDKAGSLKMTVLIGIAVGLLPCPTALAAYFSGLSSGNLAQGYLTIGVFSAGIAISLVASGYVLQWVGGWLRQVSSSSLSGRRFAYLQGAAIFAIGCFYLSRLLMESTAS